MEIPFLDNAQLNEQDNQITVSMKYSVDDILHFLELIHTSDHIVEFILLKMSFEQKKKLLVICDYMKNTDKMDESLSLGLYLVDMLVGNILQTCCTVEKEMEKTSYVDAILNHFPLYITEDEFKQLHTECHELIILHRNLADSEISHEMGGPLHLN